MVPDRSAHLIAEHNLMSSLGANQQSLDLQPLVTIIDLPQLQCCLWGGVQDKYDGIETDVD